MSMIDWLSKLLKSYEDNKKKKKSYNKCYIALTPLVGDQPTYTYVIDSTSTHNLLQAWF